MRTDRRLVLMGESGECICSARKRGNPAVNCSIVSSKESRASKDSSKLVDEVLLKGGNACKLSVNDCEASDGSVKERPIFEGDRLMIEPMKESSVVLACSSSGKCRAGLNLGVFEL